MKKLGLFLGLFVCALMIVPFSGVKAANEVVEVDTAEELYAALDGENAASVSSVKLTADIKITHKINVTTDKVIDGDGHKIIFAGEFNDGKQDNTVWGSNDAYPYNGGVYVIQAYNANVTIKNITLTGGNVGLGINGANVTLEGTIDVSGNGFGGIELTKGAAPTLSVPSLTMNNVTLVNSSESKTTPTLWTDNLETEEVENMNIEYNGVKVAVSYAKEEGKPAQVQLFLNEKNLPEGEKYTELDASDYRPEETITPENPEEKPEDTKTEEEVKDEVENPKTSDGIILVVGTLTLSAAAIVIAKKKLA